MPMKFSQTVIVTIALLGALMTHASSSDSPTGKNRLADSKSPYLLQHADNPVDWYPWGEEAFAKAKAEDKPIFLSPRIPVDRVVGVLEEVRAFRVTEAVLTGW